MKRRLTAIAFFTAVAMLSASSAAAVPKKHTAPDGSVPPKWDLPKPKTESHADVPPVGGGATGDGSNSLSFASFDSGDILVGLGDSITGHAGEWDDYYYSGSPSNLCVWSAQKSLGRVVRESAQAYRTYDRGYGLWVPSVTAAARAAARTYCRSQNGEPYVLTSLKSDQSKWYCSKLPWASYRYTANLDLDGNGGLYVWPADLINDSQTSLFASSN